MDTDVVKETLSDGSSVFAVVFIDGSNRCTINCIDETHAYALKRSFTANACYADITHNCTTQRS